MRPIMKTSRRSILIVLTLVSACGTDSSQEHAFDTSLAGGGYQVSLETWQKDAYRDIAVITSGWPQHTTMGVAVTDLRTGAVTRRCESDNHGSAIDSGLVQKTGSQACPFTFASLAEAQAFADELCSCTCDSRGEGSTTFLGQDVAADLISLEMYLRQVDHGQLNELLRCRPGAGVDPTQRLIDALDAQPRDYEGARALLSQECSPRWAELPALLLGALWGSYHVCNNDAALELEACTRGACPSWPADEALIDRTCQGPRVMRP
jgi:hypothetical protein